MENGPKGARYSNSPSGWFDATTFNDWFESLMLPKMKKQPGKKVLICGNLSSHISVQVLQLCEQNNISFVCLPPNSTHLTQPLDLLKNLLNVLEENTKQNLTSGFRKCGICPTNVDELLAMISSAEVNQSEVENSFLEALAAKRTEVTQTKTRKRKKIAVVAGKSIDPEILTEEASTSQEANQRQQKSSKVKEKQDNGEDSDISNDQMSVRDESDDAKIILKNLSKKTARKQNLML
ncbi:hypothetical protein NQ315_006149 [Exocentrus adspersus]|uniref:DDE-1 domain-containing protein n=1 Tax=Exocentrus adspersus TaxID=1586481 RepID=A0AAV8VDA3_9CUCU|nr:hypothetical protein NQ315_006149 [Exocentrus adspersus]